MNYSKSILHYKLTEMENSVGHVFKEYANKNKESIIKIQGIYRTKVAQAWYM